MQHVMIWGGWYGSRNLGDQALLLTIMDLLSDAAGDVQFHVLTDDPAHVRAYTKAESSQRVRVWHNRPEVVGISRQLARSNLFVFGGGAPFFQEPRHLLVMSGLITIARMAGTPYMTWSVSSQRVQSRIAKVIFGWVLRGAQAITVRDEHTLALFHACGVRSEISLTPDPAYALESAPEARAREILSRARGEREISRPLVGLTPRRLRGADREAETHYIPKKPEQIEQQIECYAAALDWAWEQGYQPLFVPMNTKAPDDDRMAAKEVIDRARHGGSALLIDEGLRPISGPAIYSLCQFSLVSRVHGSITSMIGGCPMAMYAFAPKHAGIMAQMGMNKYSIFEREATPARTILTLSALREGRESIRARMRTRLEQLRADATIPAQYGAKILSG